MEDKKKSFSENKVAILLSVYNGEKYLEDQIESLLNQSYRNFIIVVRDDGSTDNSVKIVEQYKTANPDKFCIVPNENKNLGASGSFAYLIEFSIEHKETLSLDTAYIMFCDQDDIWFSNKIETQMRAMIDSELSAEGQDPKPVLVHSDLEVVSETAAPIAPSLVKYQGLEVHRNLFPHLVISNLVTGCTALINESLAKKCLPINDDAIMHDWWIALVATAFGDLVYLDQPLVHYRQHGNNTIGAKEFIKPPVVSRSFWQKVFARKANIHLVEVGIQAGAFLSQYGNLLSFKQRMALRFSKGMRIRIGSIQRVFYRIARRF